MSKQRLWAAGLTPPPPGGLQEPCRAGLRVGPGGEQRSQVFIHQLLSVFPVGELEVLMQ